MRQLVAGLTLCLLAACGRGEPWLELRLFAMGTWVDLSLGAPSESAHAALEEIETLLRGYERDYYAWADDGELARVNAALASGRSIEVDSDMAELLAAAQRLAAASGYVFDPAVGGLVELWGFHSDLAARGEPPAADAIDAWLEARPSIASLRISGRRLSGGSAALKLDLGGIAKGHAVDTMVAILLDHGIGDAVINAGGDLRVLGSRNGRAWRIGIQSPRGPGVLGVIALASGEAAFTSGDYERYYERDGRRLHHILDPTTGYPADHTQAISVIAADGVTADAAATALFVAGPERWRQVARDLGIDAVLRVDASGEIQMSEAMRDRLQLSEASGSDIIPRAARGPEP